MKSKIIAAVDMGTNSFHLLIGFIKDNGALKILDREKEIIRLGSHKGKDLSVISEGEIEKAIDILNGFKNLAEFHKAEIIAVATSAVREANNQKEFLDKVFSATGIKVNVIDGIQEAGLIFKGINKAINIRNDNVVCIDIGGGSTEIVFGEKGFQLFSESLKIGAVRLSKMFFPDYVLTPERISECNEYISSQVESLPAFNADYGIGTSGTISSAAKIIFYQDFGENIKSLNGFSFTSEEFDDIFDLVMSAETIAARLAIQGMEIKRADIIPVGLMIFNQLIKKYNLRKITISEYALRTGIIVDSLNPAYQDKIIKVN